MSENKYKILVADDDPEILSMVSLRLRKAGFTVNEAADGEQALASIKDEPPDLVVLDVMMPGKNGWEVAREIRQDESNENIGIVMLTAIGERINEMTSPLYGADEHIDKPFDFSDLESKIRGVLEKRER